MKPIGAALLTHIQGEVTTLAMCWKITRKDAVIMGFTGHVEDLVVSGVTYQAKVGSYTASEIHSSSDLAVDNLELSAIFDSAAITEADLIAGKYDYATIEIFLVNYADLTMGTLSMRSGMIGDVVADGGIFRAELHGLTQQLQQVIGRTYSKRCDADLGDSRCTVALAGFTVTGTVSSFSSRSVFVGSSVPTRPGGKLTWTSGLNNGLVMEVKSLSGSTVTLSQPMPYAIAATDAYSVHTGCDKLPATCKTVFANIINFQGFPFIPGPDKVYAYPDAK